MNLSPSETSRQGLLLGIAAYGLWGLIPFYFRSLGNLPPLEVLGHRVLWSLLFLGLLLTARRRWPQIVSTFKSRRLLFPLCASAALIGVNWFTYIFAVAHQRVLEASLGYFITPLVNVLLGVVFLRERLRPLQRLSVVVAVVGVSSLAVTGAGVPWISLTLAISFAFYGLLRKTIAIDSMQGLFVETLVLSPLALLLLAAMTSTETAVALRDVGYHLPLLMLGGVVTTVPLLCFAGAARRLRMSTLGFLQYLSPTLQFIVAVVAFKEPFSSVQLVSFACIWLAIGMYSADSLRLLRQPRTTHLEPVAVAD